VLAVKRERKPLSYFAFSDFNLFVNVGREEGQYKRRKEGGEGRS
jgi:hypothetical protein